MDGHFGYASKSFNEFCHSLDNIQKLEIGTYMEKYDSLLMVLSEKENDVQVIHDDSIVTSDFLIKNIEAAFKVWDQPFSKHLNFDEFCEYLLPYRINNEPLEEWRDYYNTAFLPVFMQKMKESKSENLMAVCIQLIDYFKPYYKSPFISLPDFKPTFLPTIRTGTCNEYTQLGVFCGRTIGLPITKDFTPHWALRSGGHYWNAVLDTLKTLHPFDDIEVSVANRLSATPLNVLPKVFRMTYARQNESLALLHGNEDIPDEYTSPFLKDVSKQYFVGKDISVDLTLPSPNINTKFAYICVFNNQTWVPIYWSGIINKKAIFKTMNVGITYLPGYYFNGSIIPAAYPLKVNKDSSIVLLKPNKDITQTLILKRKYTDVKIKDWTSIMIGGKFQVSNDMDFNITTDIYKINERPECAFNSINIESDSAYKYFRFLSLSKSKVTVAEMKLYSKNEVELKGKVITPEETENYDAQKAFDDNVITYSQNKGVNSWIGLEFEKPQKISKLVFLPRNDDNFIKDKEIYELFYWDNKWISLGRQTGSITTQSLTYPNAPTNALFVLRNLTKGSEERIFTYENSKQVWW